MSVLRHELFYGLVPWVLAWPLSTIQTLWFIFIEGVAFVSVSQRVD